ncbi:hypothetical protein [Lysinibacillus xylanilyticus]|uniref:hypothetical protein n=1 Tax=Lysinibacillus xylanilyticus TaxID=582475 RepID=UPI00083C90D3|nr:hypothetical protein [Lysinibacillus xylanilyticus]
MFEIKYEIFEDDVEELRVMDMLTFDKEYNQIYGSFTLTVGGHDFIPYPPDHIPLSAKRLYSELILTYFELLNILRLVVQTKAMVCATILFSRSEEKSTSLWDHIESVS